ncbi:MAG: MBL fold metallo-hydrolase [Candidatus Thorarchaeota archaeon]
MSKLRSVDRVEIIILVDNTIDWSSANDHNNIFTPRQWVGEKEELHYLQAGHGFSALVRVRIENDVHTVLYDTGPSANLIAHNVQTLGIALGKVDAIAMSHGHWDHFGGLDWILSKITGKPIPVHVHPRTFMSRAVLKESDDESARRNLPDIISKNMILEAGGEPITNTEPVSLGDSTFLLSGEVPRTTQWETGFKGHIALVDGAWQDDHEIIDDQCLIVNVKGKGVVIISGCSHAGIVNMTNYRLELTGENKVEAVIGGFHLGGAKESVLEKTVESMKKINPSMIVPTHCTGWKAQRHMENVLKQSFARSSVGNMYVFQS